MHLNVLTQCSPAPFLDGMWRDPSDRSGTGYRSLDYWVWMGRRLEEACIDALFFADIHGVFDVYQGSWRPAVRHGVQVPVIDPVPVVAALAATTRHLGLAVTYSTSYHAPYQCARLFSTLDHLAAGRIGWNIVISDIRLGEAVGLCEHLPHDERYDRADDYVALVRALWEQSWDDDAVVRNAARDVFADDGKVREITHDSQWFRLRGPHSCEVSPQRTPVLYQAGASSRGLAFAARHAEVAFVTLGSPRAGAAQVAQLRALAAEHGRGRADLKVLQGSPVIIAENDREARAKADAYVELTSREGQLAKWCTWARVDIDRYPPDADAFEVIGEDGVSITKFLDQLSGDRTWTVRDLRDLIATPQRPHRYARTVLFGTPSQVADRMEEWMSRTDIDGFNLYPCPPTAGIDDICDLLVPELRQRGLFRSAYDPAEKTLRERYFGAGRSRLPMAAEPPAGREAVAAGRVATTEKE
ncbi:NtaA/DmoA family FMN-dependent monooxygenase [Micromonospora sp. CPCC 206061]|uniref:NtaA/DmoA family FMN-dependent monooxygenase n=1 Tax=Micromonospora sp. CPCC 206061 TaxID=3122410 RepID=UPI002FF0538B